MGDFSFLKIETVYNLREENRQLRKAHQDIHTQLQDVKVKCHQAFDCAAFACFTLQNDFKGHSLILCFTNLHCYFGLCITWSVPNTSTTFSL